MAATASEHRRQVLAHRREQHVDLSSVSEPAGRVGAREACHRISSMQRFPNPATTDWSSRTAFSAARRPASR
jgi:hypothetical protein